MPFPIFVGTALALAAGTMVATARLSNRGSPAIIAAFVGAFALVLYHGLAELNFVVDDAFITFRYSRHLADGLGPNWNNTGHVEGYTSFLWMALLAGLARISLDIVIWSRVLGGLAMLGTFGAVYAIWKLWSAEDEEGHLQSPILLAAVLVSLGLSGSVAFWTFSGLETPLFACLITASAYFHMAESRQRRFPWSALTLAAAAMTRPEGLFIVVVAGVFKLAALARSQEREADLRALVSWAAVYLALFLPWFAWKYAYYGYPLPNTYYAKTEFRIAVFDRGMHYLITNGFRYEFLWMLLGILFLAATAKPRLRTDALYLAATCGVLLAAVVSGGGDYLYHGRFVMPVQPLLYLGGLTGLVAFVRAAVRQPMHASLIVSAAFTLGSLQLVQLSDDPILRQERFVQHEMRSLGTWFDQNTPPNYTIGVFAAGVVSYYAHNRNIVDMFGINDETIAHTEVPSFGKSAPGHERYNVDYVLDVVKPQIIVAAEGQRHPLSADGIRGLAASSFTYGPTVLLRDPRLFQYYDVRWLITDGIWYNLLVRKDASPKLRGPGLISGHEQNLLTKSGGDAATGWTAWRSTLQPSNDGIEVRSAEVAYGPYGRTSSSGVLPQGQSYLAIVWVRTDRTIAANDYVSISLRENGKHSPETETNGYFYLTPQWQPIWVERTVTGGNTKYLSMHLIKFSGVAKEDSFFFRDGELGQISE